MAEVAQFEKAVEQTTSRAVKMTPSSDNGNEQYEQLFNRLRKRSNHLRILSHPTEKAPTVAQVRDANWDDMKTNGRCVSNNEVIQIEDTTEYHSLCLDLLREYGRVLLGYTTHRDVWRPTAEVHAAAVVWVVGRRLDLCVDRSPSYAAIWQRETVDGFHEDDERTLRTVTETAKEAERVAAVARQLLSIASDGS